MSQNCPAINWRRISVGQDPFERKEEKNIVMLSFQNCRFFSVYIYLTAFHLIRFFPRNEVIAKKPVWGGAVRELPALFLVAVACLGFFTFLFQIRTKIICLLTSFLSFMKPPSLPLPPRWKAGKEETYLREREKDKQLFLRVQWRHRRNSQHCQWEEERKRDREREKSSSPPLFSLFLFLPWLLSLLMLPSPVVYVSQKDTKVKSRASSNSSGRSSSSSSSIWTEIKILADSSCRDKKRVGIEKVQERSSRQILQYHSHLFLGQPFWNGAARMEIPVVSWYRYKH